MYKTAQNSYFPDIYTVRKQAKCFTNAKVKVQPQVQKETNADSLPV